MKKNKKIKVLLCSPYLGAVGGISKWTNHILSYYQENKQDDMILTHYYETIQSGLNDSSLIKRLFEGFKNYYLIYLGLLNRLKEQKYDVVHFCSSASISLIKDIIFLKTVKRKGIKTIIHFRFGRIPELSERNNWEYKLLQYVIKIADNVIVIDQKTYHTLLNKGFKNIFLLPNPLTNKVIQIIDDNKFIEKIDRKIVFVGHIIPTKGIFELVEACKQIDSVKLKMIGFITQKTKNILLEKAGNSYDEWFDIEGEQDYKVTIKEMLSAGVFVLPTYTEGFPNVILESMACACPIVTTNVGAIPEMLDISNGMNYGICVEPRNIEQLKSSIEYMLENRDYALKCGKNAQKRVHELYSIEKVWTQLENIWNCK
jgi:glycosyltransferase involved in cell wall biosynthesis